MLDIEKHLFDKAAAAGFTQQGAVEVARFIGALTRLAGPRRALELGTGMGLTTFLRTGCWTASRMTRP